MIRGGRSYGTNDLVGNGIDQVSNVKEASSYVAKSSLSTQHVVEKSINMASSLSSEMGSVLATMNAIVTDMELLTEQNEISILTEKLAN